MKSRIIKKFHKPFGFTFIEVMIVLAIAGLIMAVVFIALPEEQRSQRDASRKDYANRVVEAALEFYKNNNAMPTCSYPNTDPSQCPNAPTDAVRFITKYMPEGTDPSTGESYAAATAGPVTVPSMCNGTGTPTGSAIYCWDDTSSFFINHNLVPRLGQVVIVALHPCVGGQHGSGSGLYGYGTITDIDHGTNDKNIVSVIIGLEQGDYYCATNGNVQWGS